jgi:hypothetical protein
MIVINILMCVNTNMRDETPGGLGRGGLPDGLMLFLDPLQGLREMRCVLKPDGGFRIMAFSVPDNNPCMATLMSIALHGQPVCSGSQRISNF